MGSCRSLFGDWVVGGCLGLAALGALRLFKAFLRVSRRLLRRPQRGAPEEASPSEVRSELRVEVHREAAAGFVDRVGELVELVREVQKAHVEAVGVFRPEGDAARQVEARRTAEARVHRLLAEVVERRFGLAPGVGVGTELQTRPLARPTDAVAAGEFRDAGVVGSTPFELSNVSL